MNKTQIEEVKKVIADYCNVHVSTLADIDGTLGTLPKSAGDDFIEYISCLLSLDDLKLDHSGVVDNLALLDESREFSQMLLDGNLYASYLLLAIIDIGISQDLTIKADTYYKEILGRIGYVGAYVVNDKNKSSQFMLPYIVMLIHAIRGICFERYKRHPAAHPELIKARTQLDRLQTEDKSDLLSNIVMFGSHIVKKENIRVNLATLKTRVEKSISICKPELSTLSVTAAWPNLVGRDSKQGKDDGDSCSYPTASPDATTYVLDVMSSNANSLEATSPAPSTVVCSGFPTPELAAEKEKGEVAEKKAGVSRMLFK